MFVPDCVVIELRTSFCSEVYGSTTSSASSYWTVIGFSDSQAFKSVVVVIVGIVIPIFPKLLTNILLSVPQPVTAFKCEQYKEEFGLIILLRTVV